jgi:hypothetical protein
MEIYLGDSLYKAQSFVIKSKMVAEVFLVKKTI